MVCPSIPIGGCNEKTKVNGEVGRDRGRSQSPPIRVTGKEGIGLRGGEASEGW